MSIHSSKLESGSTTKSEGGLEIDSHYDSESLIVSIGVWSRVLFSQSHLVLIDGVPGPLTDGPLKLFNLGLMKNLRGKTIRIVSTIVKVPYPSLPLDENNDLKEDVKIALEYIYHLSLASSQVSKDVIEGLASKKLVEQWITTYKVS